MGTARRVRSSSRSIRSSAKDRRGIPPLGADGVGPVEIRQHEYEEQLGARSRTERVQTLPQSALELIESHGRETNAAPRHALAGSLHMCLTLLGLAT